MQGNRKCWGEDPPTGKDDAPKISCSGGHYSGSGSTSCTSCTPGKMLVNSETQHENEACESCKDGQYGPWGSFCHNCTAGKYLVDAKKGETDACRVCESSKYSAAAASSCASCPDGKYIRAGNEFHHDDLSDCIVCPEHRVLEDNHCKVKCGLGEGTQTGNNTNTSTPAPGLFFTAETSSVKIARNPPYPYPIFKDDGWVRGRIEVKPSENKDWGTISSFEWDDTDALVACRQLAGETGIYRVLDASALDKLETKAVSEKGSGKQWWSNFKCDGSEIALKSCYYTDVIWQPDHQKDIGIACKLAEYSSCEVCPAGRFSDTEGSEFCVLCPSGRYSASEGAKSAADCKACGRGEGSNAGDSACAICESGKYANTSCVDCPPGRYSNTAGSTSSDACLPCRDGTGIDFPGASAESACIPCLPGQYSSSATSNICVECEAGKYSSMQKSAACFDCSAGKYSSKHAVSCDWCGPGEGSSAGASSCSRCEGSYSDGYGQCTPCSAGRYSSYSGAITADNCLPCQPGETSKLGAKSCSRCGIGEFTGVECSVRNCLANEYNNNGICTTCNKVASTFVLLGSFTSYALAAWYSSFVASNRAKMMRLRVTSSFYQTAELTTLIKIPWPEIVFLTLPFQFPISDTSCLTKSSGWTQVHTFYAYIYGPILLSLVPLLNASSSPPRSLERKKATTLITLLLSLWYSPLLQTVASMYDCFEDGEREGKAYLISDPSVSCEPSSERTFVHFHSFAISAFVGVGFPAFSYFKIQSLKEAGKLDFDEGFSSLYQFYNTKMPHFESFQFARRGLLILLLTLLQRERPAIHACFSLVVNGLFLVLILYTKPFIYFPSPWRGCNLYQGGEVISTLTCMIGNSLGLIGSLLPSSVYVLGHVLACMNLIFVVILICVYKRQVSIVSKATKSRRGVRSRRCHVALGEEINEALEEWDTLMTFLTLQAERQDQLIDEMPFVRSRVIAAVRTMFMETEEQHSMRVDYLITEAFDADMFKTCCRQYQAILEHINAEYQSYTGETCHPSTVLEIASAELLTFVCSVLEGDFGGGGNLNPLQIEMVPLSTRGTTLGGEDGG